MTNEERDHHEQNLLDNGWTQESLAELIRRSEADGERFAKSASEYEKDPIARIVLKLTAQKVCSMLAPLGPAHSVWIANEVHLCLKAAHDNYMEMNPKKDKQCLQPLS